MELKSLSPTFFFNAVKLLIEPYGIEMVRALRSFGARCLLIEPYGIEIEAHVASDDDVLPLLIEPYGIEISISAICAGVRKSF